MNTIKKIWSNPDLRNCAIILAVIIGIGVCAFESYHAYEVWSKHNHEHAMPYEEWLVLKRHRLLPGQQSLKP